MRFPFVLALALSAPVALAMEGMWLPGQMGELSEEATRLGLKLDPSVLSQIDGPVLGATVDLDYCSAAFVSPDGLIATAYHCVTDGLQYASAADEDLFEDGFHARSRAEERWAGPVERIRVTVGMEDVSARSLDGTKKLTGRERLDKIEENNKQLVKKCESAGDVHCEVANFDGRQYHLIKQIDVRDVRLVYAPPNAVGYFGEDADNWKWPRHSGDFAFIRAYVAPDGRSRDYHPDNVPYQPKHWLKTADRGPQQGEFVMVPGYPAGTWRWRSAAELDHRAQDDYARRIETIEAVMGILDRHAKSDATLSTKIAPRVLNLSNDVIYLQGNLDAFRRLGTTKEKWGFEQDLSTWIASDPERAGKFKDVLPSMHRLQAEAASTGQRDHLFNRMLKDVALLKVATSLYQLSVEAAKPDPQRREGFQNRDRPDLAAELDGIDATFDWRVDRDLLRYYLQRVSELPPGLRPQGFDVWMGSRPTQGTPVQIIDAELKRLYANTDLYHADKRRSLMDTSTWYLEHSGNPWFELAAALQPHIQQVWEEEQKREAEWRLIRPLYVEAVEGFYPEARPRYDQGTGTFEPGLWYPDANSTLRVTIGRVEGYYPRDGLIAAPRSRLQGISEKSGPAPYDVQPALLGAIQAGDWGPYGDPQLDSVSVNFLSDLDTARGSSGSATLNADGEFVGIIFDGNYEAMASDWVFEPALTRSIHTDVSYILWYLDRVAGAHTLLEELGKKPYFIDGGAADL